MIEQQLLRRIKTGIFLSGLCVFAQLYVFQPLLPAISGFYHTSASASSWCVSLSTLGMAAGLFLYAFRADALPRKKIMVNAILWASLITTFTPWMPRFEIVLICCFLKGVLLSGVTAVALAYLSEEVKLTHLGIVIGLYLSGNTVGGMMGRTGALLISEYTSWQWAVSSIGILCFTIGLLFRQIFPSSRNFTPKLPIYKLKRLKMFAFLKYRQLLALYILGAVIMSCFVAVYNYISFELIHHYKLDTHLVAAIFSMYLIGVYASVIAGKWTDRYASRHILWMLIGLYIAGDLCFFVPVLGMQIAGLVCITFAFFAAHTLATRMVSQSVLTAKSTATSLYWLFYYIGSSITGIAAGHVYDHYGWNGMVLFLLLLLTIALGLSLYLKNTYKVL